MADDNKGTPPAGLTQEQLDSWINEQLGKTVNNMLTARLGTFEKKLKESLGPTMAEALKAQLPDLLKDFSPPSKKGDDDDGGKKDKGSNKDNPEIATMRQKMIALEQKQAETEARNLALREKARSQAVREQVRTHLGKWGIDGERFDAAYALLDYKGQIVKAEDIDSDDAFFRRFPTDDPVAVEVGLADWVKNDPAAKLYLPPAGTRGSGSRPGNRPAGGQLTPDQVRANIAAELERELGR